MKRASRARQPTLLADIEASLTELQPQLKVVGTEPEIAIEGSFLLVDDVGPFDQFQVRILIGYGYPEQEPKVSETGGRIPKILDRHINNSGFCCLTVWETWLVAPDTSFKGFLKGPMHEFFLSQCCFEKRGVWPLGERSHGRKGILEAYADMLRVAVERETVVSYLKALAKARLKEHWSCPCGSGLKVKHCHLKKLRELHRRVPYRIAKRMLNRLGVSTGQQGKTVRALRSRQLSI